MSLLTSSSTSPSPSSTLRKSKPKAIYYENEIPQMSAPKVKIFIKRIIIYLGSLLIGAFIIKRVGGFFARRVDGYRQGNLHRFASIVALEWAMAHMDVIIYFHLFSAISSEPFMISRSLIKKRNEKYRIYCFICFGLLVIMTHLTYLFYLIENFEVSPFLYDFSAICNGIWINLFALCLIFTIFNLTLKFLTAISIGRTFLKKLFLVRPIKFFCINTKFQVGLTLVLAAVFSISHWYASDMLVIRQQQIKISRHTDTTKPLRVAVLTDLHAGASVYAKQIAKVVQRINELDDLDAIFLIGDIIDAPRALIEERVEALQHLRSRLGTFFVTGNHEYYYGNVNEWFELFETYGIRVLKNRAVRMKDYCVVGLNDIFSDYSGIYQHTMDVNAIKACPINQTTIVLAHNPAATKQILQYSKDTSHPVDLILSGHTHCAQYFVLIPFAYSILPYLYGLYSLNGGATQLLVSAGTLYQNAPMKIPFMSEIWMLEILPSLKNE